MIRQPIFIAHPVRTLIVARMAWAEVRAHSEEQMKRKTNTKKG